MLESFANPWAMAAGTALISSPIIIHLINRLRYRRIRWAAMEFLLKAQKRIRRRLIIEQLILLLLRISLVLLLGVLLARFLGFRQAGGSDANAITLHVILLDDTPSMGDSFKNRDGRKTDSFQVAKSTIVDRIVATANQAPTPQHLVLLRLSDLTHPFPNEQSGRINTTLIRELQQHLDQSELTTVHISPLAGLQAARTILDANPEQNRYLHFVSDFRTADWSREDREQLTTSLGEMSKAGIRVHFHDVAAPDRKPTQSLPDYHPNLGIVDLRAESPLAVPDLPVEFTVRLANYSPSEKSGVQLTVRINGEEKQEFSVVVPSLPPNVEVEERVLVRFDKPLNDDPLSRFQLVTVSLPEESTGLAFDNTRHALVEVVDSVPLLLIDSNPLNEGRTPADDSFNLLRFFSDAVPGYSPVVKSVEELERPDLRKYGGIYLLNVPRLTPKGLKNLEEYVRSGGGVAFFLGPKIDRAFYNEFLWADGKGLLPAPLANNPNLEPIPAKIRGDYRAAMFSGIKTFVMQLIPRASEEDHPTLRDLYRDERGLRVNPEDYNKFLRFVIIDKYWPVTDRAKWSKDRKTHELLSLPNFKPIETYQDRVRSTFEALFNSPKVKTVFEASGGDELKETLESWRRQFEKSIRDAKPLYELSMGMEEMLKGEEDKANKRVALKEFWQRPELIDARKLFEELLNDLRYGDPIYMAKEVGNGRVVLFTTTANATWNDINGFGRPYFPPLLKLMQQKYLGAAGTDVNQLVGERIEMRFDSTQFSENVRRLLLTPEALKALKDKPLKKDGDKLGVGDTMEKDPDSKDLLLRYNLTLKDKTYPSLLEPGGYLLQLGIKQAPSAEGEKADEVPLYRGFVLNVDTRAEGDLRRMDREELLKQSPGAQLHTVDTNLTEVLKLKENDLSEGWRLYVLLLLILLAEQAMAVRLSFHQTTGGPATTLGALGAVARN